MQRLRREQALRNQDEYTSKMKRELNEKQEKLKKQAEEKKVEDELVAQKEQEIRDQKAERFKHNRGGSVRETYASRLKKKSYIQPEPVDITPVEPLQRRSKPKADRTVQSPRNAALPVIYKTPSNAE